MVTSRDPRWRTGKRNGPEPAVYPYLEFYEESSLHGSYCCYSLNSLNNITPSLSNRAILLHPPIPSTGGQYCRWLGRWAGPWASAGGQRAARSWIWSICPRYSCWGWRSSPVCMGCSSTLDPRTPAQTVLLRRDHFYTPTEEQYAICKWEVCISVQTEIPLTPTARLKSKHLLPVHLSRGIRAVKTQVHRVSKITKIGWYTLKLYCATSVSFFETQCIEAKKRQFYGIHCYQNYVMTSSVIRNTTLHRAPGDVSPRMIYWSYFAPITWKICKVLWWVCLSVSLSVCTLAYLKNYTAELRQIFCACWTCPWLDPSQAAYSVYAVHFLPVLWMLSRFDPIGPMARYSD